MAGYRLIDVFLSIFLVFGVTGCGTNIREKHCSMSSQYFCFNKVAYFLTIKCKNGLKYCIFFRRLRWYANQEHIGVCASFIIQFFTRLLPGNTVPPVECSSPYARCLVIHFPTGLLVKQLGSWSVKRFPLGCRLVKQFPVWFIGNTRPLCLYPHFSAMTVA